SISPQPISASYASAPVTATKYRSPAFLIVDENSGSASLVITSYSDTATYVRCVGVDPVRYETLSVLAASVPAATSLRSVVAVNLASVPTRPRITTVASPVWSSTHGSAARAGPASAKQAAAAPSPTTRRDRCISLSSASQFVTNGTYQCVRA